MFNLRVKNCIVEGEKINEEIIKSTRNKLIPNEKQMQIVIGLIGTLIFGVLFYIFHIIFTNSIFWPITPLRVYGFLYCVCGILFAFSLYLTITRLLID